MKKAQTSWTYAADMVADFVKQPARLSHLLERLPAGSSVGMKRSCQSLLFGVVRHIRFLEKGLDTFIKKRPKPGVWSMLLVSSWELHVAPDKSAKIVHNAVEEIGRKYSRSEKGMANAVLRKMTSKLAELAKSESVSASDLSWRYSHPRWLIERWFLQFGVEQTIAFLAWNQEEPKTFARWQVDSSENSQQLDSPWPGFFEIEKSGWSEALRLLDDGRIYVQNPAARVAPAKLADLVKSGRVLDLCSAPGGKALLLDSILDDRVSEIVAFDLPGARFEKMVGNFERYSVRRIRPLAGDLRLIAESDSDFGVFDGVLLDAPCSNTGVLQHKVDARWRINEARLGELVQMQFAFISRAARFVASGGILVYSTCSIDREENGDVVARFLEASMGADFTLLESKVLLPWKCRHDGAGVFVLRRA